MPEIRGVKSTAAALWQALTGRAYSTHKKESTQQAARSMVNRWGKKGTAQRLGVSIRTVERYLSGTIKAPSKRNKEAFEAAHRAAKITKGRADKFAAGGASPGVDPASGRPIVGSGGMTIFGRFRVSEDERDRVIPIGDYVPDGQLERVIDAVIQYGPEAGAEALNGVLAHYVPGMVALEIYQIDY